MSLKSAILFVCLLLAILQMLFLAIAPNAPLRGWLSGKSMQITTEQNFTAADENFQKAANGENLEMHFDGFDATDDPQGRLMCLFYFRAVYAIYPRRLVIGYGDSVINSQAQLAAADVLPGNEWLKKNGISRVLTIHYRPDGSIDDSDVRAIR